MVHTKCDHNKQQITLTVTTLSSFHCRSSLVDYEYNFMKKYNKDCYQLPTVSTGESVRPAYPAPDWQASGSRSADFLPDPAN